MRALTLFAILSIYLTFNVQAYNRLNNEEIVRLGTVNVVVYTYTPKFCGKPKLLFVFAGYNRNAESYLNRSKLIADRSCLIALAPRFDRERFPNWRYHRAGVFYKNKIQPRNKWTAPLLEELIEWARTKVGRPNMPYILFGHSAGAQFLSRIAAYSPPKDPWRIVIANPSVYVTPSLTESVPYGFGGFSKSFANNRKLQDYLNLPITIYLGTKDQGNKLLVQNEHAKRQGNNRYERGLNVFRSAQNLAQKNDWHFNWKLVEAGGVGHSSRRMLQAPQVSDAFGLTDRSK